MSHPKFLVFKLQDLKIPFIMLAVAVVAFSVFMLSGDDTTATFAPDDSYEDGMYIANIAFTDADMDLVVEVKDKQIKSISLDGFDETERTLYKDLNESIPFVNDYVTSTQSLDLPETSTISASTSILMDAIKIALSDNKDAVLTTSYEVPLLEAITEETADGESLKEETPNEEALQEEEATEDVISENVTSDDATGTEDTTIEE
ncbi:MAG: hypothetical protein ACLSH8_14620 [Zhenhengia sp.]|jgi:uncharacterized protein with FMN-binding domain|uniref:FMN-binding domain-containing protein n=2 Tax=Zhenhengia TaxID=2944196 RepID=A0A926EJD7_9FIRM|nr:hypothetical protein [Zhenhengia yiwuensis]MBC8580771.1 hypothetical protein [Zhenhengia yiwuensis]MBP3911397.1 hypothetical protein [Niameybacter sp.]MDU6358753.1 hypothetical protein [Clostridiales bacterium]MDY3367325.1 hypothetical protein [Zhenhengia yiwuensis]